MAKRINVYLSDSDIEKRGDITGSQLLEIARRTTHTHNTPTTHITTDDTLLQEVYNIVSKLSIDTNTITNNTQFIVDSINNNRRTQPKQEPKQEPYKKDWSPAQLSAIDRAYNNYIKHMQEENDRGTDSRDYTSTMVFDKPNDIDEILHQRLADWLKNESGLDYTQFGLQDS